MAATSGRLQIGDEHLSGRCATANGIGEVGVRRPGGLDHRDVVPAGAMHAIDDGGVIWERHVAVLSFGHFIAAMTLLATVGV